VESDQKEKKAGPRGASGVGRIGKHVFGNPTQKTSQEKILRRREIHAIDANAIESFYFSVQRKGAKKGRPLFNKPAKSMSQ
jgi:hypothetical protein